MQWRSPELLTLIDVVRVPRLYEIQPRGRLNLPSTLTPSPSTSRSTPCSMPLTISTKQWTTPPNVTLCPQGKRRRSFDPWPWRQASSDRPGRHGHCSRRSRRCAAIGRLSLGGSVVPRTVATRSRRRVDRVDLFRCDTCDAGTVRHSGSRHVESHVLRETVGELELVGEFCGNLRRRESLWIELTGELADRCCIGSIGVQLDRQVVDSRAPDQFRESGHDPAFA